MISKYEIKVAVDAVVFSFRRKEGVCVLLMKRKEVPFLHRWSLPGSFVESDVSLERTIRRELLDATALKINYLEQLFTFGRPERDPRGRVVSVAYLGLVKRSRSEIENFSDTQWHSIDALPDLAFDHLRIIETAIARLKEKLGSQPLGFELLDNQFPFSDLEKVYLALRDEELDRRNFKKKVMSLGILEELNETVVKGRGRPARLYKFNRHKYFALKETGWQFEV